VYLAHVRVPFVVGWLFAAIQSSKLKAQSSKEVPKPKAKPQTAPQLVGALTWNLEFLLGFEL
jgi:hypothetical protein